MVVQERRLWGAATVASPYTLQTGWACTEISNYDHLQSHSLNFPVCKTGIVAQPIKVFRPLLERSTVDPAQLRESAWANSQSTKLAQGSNPNSGG